MSQNIEIEFKNMLTKEEYGMLLRGFKIGVENIFSQENHYFDTRDFALKELGAALRIRKKGESYEMTLKQPAPVGLLETNQLLSNDEAKLAIEQGMLPAGIVQDIVKDMDISYKSIEYFGSLMTMRTEFEYKKGLLVLDHSIYLDTEDFEIEYEVENYQEGQQLFIELLDQFQIPNRKTENKVRRFYNLKYKKLK